jgi:hypothetical protein
MADVSVDAWRADWATASQLVSARDHSASGAPISLRLPVSPPAHEKDETGEGVVAELWQGLNGVSFCDHTLSAYGGVGVG